MKPITFLGNSLEVIKTFPLIAKRETGHQLDRVQRGHEPKDWKPMTTVGPGVKEIRISQEGEFRVIYIAKFEEAVYVLHAFSRKTQKTRKEDLAAAKRILKQLLLEKRS